MKTVREIIDETLSAEEKGYGSIIFKTDRIVKEPKFLLVADACRALGHTVEWDFDSLIIIFNSKNAN